MVLLLAYLNIFPHFSKKKCIVTDSGSIQLSHCLKAKRYCLAILSFFLVNWLSKSSILLLIWPHSCDGGDNKHIEIIKHTLME